MAKKQTAGRDKLGSLAPISTTQVPAFNVTFEPGCRNNWHIHHAKWCEAVTDDAYCKLP